MRILNVLDREDKEIIVVGDTNCDLLQHNKEQPLDNNNTKHMCNIYELFSFKQLINNPTGVTLSSSTIMSLQQRKITLYSQVFLKLP